MHYTEEDIKRRHFRGNQRYAEICEDWLEHDEKFKRLCDAVAAVVEEWDKCDWGLVPRDPRTESRIEALDIVVEALRLVAGITAPPADEADGDAADQAYERMGDR